MNKIYENLAKNTVSAKAQLEDSQFVRFGGSLDGIKILFVGNSITLHGIKEDIGWFNEWGMAATAQENDYVHKTVELLSQKVAPISYCICQAANWELGYKLGSTLLEPYKIARDFEADIIVMRLGENCPKDDFDKTVFYSEYEKLMEFFFSNKKATFVLTTGFWYHPFDEAVLKLAKDKGLPVVTLGDLGESDEMKATGKFWHSGVAHHPSDLGMLNIAQRITECIYENVKF